MVNLIAIETKAKQKFNSMDEENEAALG